MKQDKRQRVRALYDAFNHGGAQTQLYETAGHVREIRLSRAYLSDEHYVQAHVRVGVIRLVDNTQRVFGELLRAWGAESAPEPMSTRWMELHPTTDHLMELDEIVREASVALRVAGDALYRMPSGRGGDVREAVLHACRALRNEIKRVERAASEELGVASAFSQAGL